MCKRHGECITIAHAQKWHVHETTSKLKLLYHDTLLRRVFQVNDVISRRTILALPFERPTDWHSTSIGFLTCMSWCVRVFSCSCSYGLFLWRLSFFSLCLLRKQLHISCSQWWDVPVIEQYVCNKTKIDLCLASCIVQCSRMHWMMHGSACNQTTLNKSTTMQWMHPRPFNSWWWLRSVQILTVASFPGLLHLQFLQYALYAINNWSRPGNETSFCSDLFWRQALRLSQWKGWGRKTWVAVLQSDNALLWYRKLASFPAFCHMLYLFPDHTHASPWLPSFWSHTDRKLGRRLGTRLTDRALAWRYCPWLEAWNTSL